MLHKIISDHHITLLQGWLLTIGGSSWAGYAILKSVSAICAIVLPITGVISFFLFLIISFSKIIQGFKDIWKTIFTKN